VSAVEYYTNKHPISDTILATESVLGFIDKLYVSIGESAHGGLGLFVNIKASNEEAEVHVPRGTLICEYLPGEFVDPEYPSDRAVAFGYEEEDDMTSWVYFENKLQHLWEAIYESNADAVSGGFTDVIPKAPNDLLKKLEGKSGNILDGHSVYYHNNTIQFSLSPSYSKIRFVPSNTSTSRYIYNFAQFANDMALELDRTTTEKLYDDNYQKNCLMLVWKLRKDDDGKLLPVNPVMVTKRNLTFINTFPMEIGVGYGWDYWKGRIKYWGEEILAILESNSA
jgi:hypothetical protein